MRIAFVGLPLAALLLAHDGHEVVVAGLRRGLCTGVRRLRRTIGKARVVLDPHSDWVSFRRRLVDGRADMIVSWFFPRRIPMEVVGSCPLGGLGVHPSLLPRHRGPDPFFWAIDAGDRVTGVTVHRIEAAYDTGNIVAQRSLDIDASWNAWQLAKALDRPSLSLLREVMGRAAAGKPLPSRRQDERKATHAPFPTEAQRNIRWHQPAGRIVRRIRALAPCPGAVAFTGEHCLVVQRAETRAVHPVLHPGEAAVIDGVAVVRAQDQGVALLRAEVEGQIWSAETIAIQIARNRCK